MNDRPDSRDAAPACLPADDADGYSWQARAAEVTRHFETWARNRPRDRHRLELDRALEQQPSA
jgi:hypothetical protein